MVELHTALEVPHTAEEAGHMAVVVEAPRTAVVGIDLVEVHRRAVVGVEDTPVAVGMDYEVVVRKVAAAVEGIPVAVGMDYEVVVHKVAAAVEGILPVVHTLEVPGSHHNPAEEDILEAGIGPVEVVGILLPIMSRKQSMRQTKLTRWRSSIVRWIATLMRRI